MFRLQYSFHRETTLWSMEQKIRFTVFGIKFQLWDQLNNDNSHRIISSIDMYFPHIKFIHTQNYFFGVHHWQSIRHNILGILMSIMDSWNILGSNQYG